MRLARLVPTLAVLALTTPAAAQPVPLVAAHRGGAALWPENSLLAFRNALSLGVDFLETDVHLTADGEPVILHDPTLDRTTTGTGALGDRRLAELARVRLRAADGTMTLELAEITGFWFHDLRHTAASHMVMRGAALKEMQEVLAHRDFKMTLGTSVIGAWVETTVSGETRRREVGVAKLFLDWEGGSVLALEFADRCIAEWHRLLRSHRLL